MKSILDLHLQCISHLLQWFDVPMWCPAFLSINCVMVDDCRPQVVAVTPNTLYPQLQQAFDLDPFTFSGSTRVRNATEYLRACQLTVQQMPLVGEAPLECVKASFACLLV